MMTKPTRVGGHSAAHWMVWLGFAVVLGIAPVIFNSNLSYTILSQMGIGIIVCLSYNILLGQGGMLSFGHAVYSGMGAFFAIHALNAVGEGQWSVPVSLIPLVGGVGSVVLAVFLGYVTTKMAKIPFAMITLGIGELAFAMSLMLPEFFGGEGGISGNRVTGAEPFGITFGPQIQLYYLIAVYTFVCAALMYAFTKTPLGRLLSAVRDNPERVEFIGYDPHKIRYFSFVIAAFFAGVSGGLAALNFEMVTSEVVSTYRSSAYLLFTFLGGTKVFFGPIIGAILMELAYTMFSELTKAWLLYLGLLFMFMIVYAPGGIASIIMMHVRIAAFGRLKALIPGYALLSIGALIVLGGLAGMIEMVYHLQLQISLDPEVSYLGMTLNAQEAGSWLWCVLTAVVGFILFEFFRRRVRRRWEDVQAYIEHEAIRRKEASA